MFEQELIEFDAARKLFPCRRVGAKRGNETEFKNFIRHKDWRNALPLLLPAIQRQIQWRKEVNSKNYANPKFREFIPEWPNFQTWINQRRWEEEFELPSEAKKHQNSKPISGLPPVTFKSVPNFTMDASREQQARRVEMLKNFKLR